MKPRRGQPSGAESPASAGARRTAPLWVKLAVGFHVICTVIWTLPNPAESIASGRVQPRSTQWITYWNSVYLKRLSVVNAYLFTTGTWQYWDMFAPDPANTDWYCSAEVTFKDGTVKPMAYPRIADLPLPEKFFKERYRKFYERAKDDKLPQYFVPFAMTLATWAYTDPKNPPIRVDLTRNWLRIAAPGKPQPTTYEKTKYFCYRVDQAWLQRLKPLP